jgi:adenosylcobinamide-GDP ribazoletransferase
MIRDLFKGFVLQVQFLTRIPIPLRIDFNSRSFALGTVFAPLIGLCIGAFSAGAYILTGLLGIQTLAVLAALVAEIAVTGGLHLDGLADTFDGFFSNRDRENILTIMKDSRLGTNGAIALILLILVKYVLLVSLNEKYLIGCILIMPVLSRMTIPWSAGISPYAGKDNTSVASVIIANTGALGIAAATILSLTISIIILKMAAVPLAIVIILFTLLANLYAKRKIGGITGDIFGAIIEISEVVFLIGILALDRLWR